MKCINNSKEGNTNPVIGLIGDFDQSLADGFFADIQKKEYPNASFVFSRRDETCEACLCKFINDNHITLLFVDKNVVFEGEDIAERNDIIGCIGRACQCTTYIVAHTE